MNALKWNYKKIFDKKKTKNQIVEYTCQSDGSLEITDRLMRKRDGMTERKNDRGKE